MHVTEDVPSVYLGVTAYAAAAPQALVAWFTWCIRGGADVAEKPHSCVCKTCLSCFSKASAVW